MYRRTRKADAARRAQLAAMRAAKERRRLESPAPAYPAELPDLRMRITIERLDFGSEAHVIELHRTRRMGREAGGAGMKTGWPPGLLQDDCRALFRWFANRIDARWACRKAIYG
jgi:hypothetical protein